MGPTGNKADVADARLPDAVQPVNPPAYNRYLFISFFFFFSIFFLFSSVDRVAAIQKQCHEEIEKDKKQMIE